MKQDNVRRLDGSPEETSRALKEWMGLKDGQTFQDWVDPEEPAKINKKHNQ